MAHLETCSAGETGTGHHYHRRGEKSFYVTIIRNTRAGYLLGPYRSHQEAMDNVERGRKLATDVDSWADFDSFGTASLSVDDTRRTVFGS
jgi:hypothetical protein